MVTLPLAKREEIGSKLCFHSTVEKIAGENKMVSVKIYRLFFVCMKQTIPQIFPQIQL